MAVRAPPTKVDGRFYGNEMSRAATGRILLGIAFLLLLVGRNVAAADLTIHHLDVGTGDATLLVMPNGKTLLVDAGLDGAASRVIAPFLRDLEISSLDVFVLTHYDSDHMGGVDKLVLPQEEGILVETWFDRDEWEFLPEKKRRAKQFEQYTEAAETPTQLQPGQRLRLDDEVMIVVVAVNGHVRGAVNKYPHPPNENDYSAALLVSYRGFNYFIGGDLTAIVEERLVREAALGDIDVYKVSHHGSETSSTPPFLALIRPEVAVISNGDHAGFNHPRQKVLDNLNAVSNIEIYQTNKLTKLVNAQSGLVGGNVPGAFIADPETNQDDGTITIVVRQDVYEVRMPARGFCRQYPIERPGQELTQRQAC